MEEIMRNILLPKWWWWGLPSLGILIITAGILCGVIWNVDHNGLIIVWVALPPEMRSTFKVRKNIVN